MAPVETAEANSPQANPVPPLVSRILVFFYVLTWLNLLYITYSAVEDTTDGDYGFLVPVGLYMLLFVVYAVINLLRYRRVGGRLCDILWGYDEPVWMPLAFVLLSVVLIFWMNTEAPGFWWVYTPLIAATFGMFRLQVSIPLIALEVGALIYQLNLFSLVAGGEFSTGAIIGISFSTFMFITVFVLMTWLMRSRIESEALVNELKATKRQLEEALLKEKEVAVLRERDRMAREMHDVLGHALVVVAVKIEAAQRLQ